jgi:hypothetical protein
MMMMTEKNNDDVIKILFASDLHFGVPDVCQEDMANAFRAVIFPRLGNTDILFLNGDFFDRIVIFDSAGFDPVYDLILDLFRLCEQHRVHLRILQGTFEHDRTQCQRFLTFYKNTHATFPFHFADFIQLEEITIRSRHLRILYVPDSLPYGSSEEAVDAIHGVMMEKGWDKVDYACMHGFFEFTFPKNISHANRVIFREDQFPFVRKMIDVGHVHQHRVSGKVISNGSFDRHCHGDEDPKGAISVLDYPDHYVAQFIENTNAAPFHSFVFGPEATTDDYVDTITSYLQSLVTTRDIALRFIVSSQIQVVALKSYMKEHHPKIKCAFKKIGIEDESPILTPASDLFVELEARPAPTPHTMPVFVRNYIPDSYCLSVESIAAYLESPSS